MLFPENLKYTKEHEWIRVEDNSIGVVGITDYAQSELGDIVYVELPQIGKVVKQLESFGTIEAVKAVSDLFSPVSGEIIEVNEKLKDSPDLINKDPYGEGWIIKIKIKDLNELNNLLSAEDYRKLIGK
ncbi:glycine cleavage system H protein [Candidatus Kryptobacter tengchongensis]|uniref:Glycine cleavage system H protein n=1 Tax=Kryptobacter tengchongensis TaxID=1643429 RepID=A0A916LIR0_KRYT1|nr:glycine cleavage system protein GcvH [Candidatus Kryptobacter tengchongensis]CUS81277.1 glycine cleavage system H protein [Candidatus Kryptobacter tengchongensis]CUS98973.1 glycine cleavage system H protein [Candidatus Kryptobacter tengchongensis]CUU09787.1 glycine cleavage system H protein [Candidatus Kryptobacter tengchongensis]